MRSPHDGNFHKNKGVCRINLIGGRTERNKKTNLKIREAGCQTKTLG